MSKFVAQRDDEEVKLGYLHNGRFRQEGFVTVGPGYIEFIEGEFPSDVYPTLVRAMMDQMDDEEVRQILLEYGFKRLK